jgi:hypothetical protein
MAAVIKKSLKTNIVKSIQNDILSNISRYYFTFGKAQVWNLTDTATVPTESYQQELEARNDILLMKYIDSNDSSIVVRRIDWAIGYVFDMYDDTYSVSNPAYSGATSIENAEFYALTSDYNVYKCLFNNNNKPSTIQPSGTSSGVIETSDGYVWKYLYSIPLSLRNKFLTTAYMPVISSLSSQFYSKGSITNYFISSRGYGYPQNTYNISSIEVVNGGSGYTSLNLDFLPPNSIEATWTSNGTTTVTINKTSHGFAAASKVYITFTSGASAPTAGLYTVATSAANSFTVTAASTVTTSSGNCILDTRAVATATISSGKITSINVLYSGKGYKYPPDLTQSGVNAGATGLVYNITYGRDTSTAFTDVKITGDGYNSKNPYSIKRVDILDRGEFNQSYSGVNIFVFQDPALVGRKASLNVTSRVKTIAPVTGANWSATASSTVTIEYPSSSPLKLKNGDSVTLAFTATSGTNATNATRTVSSVGPSGSNTQFAINNGTSITGSGTVTITLASTRYELDTIAISDAGYGYTTPLKYGTTVSASTGVNVTALIIDTVGSTVYTPISVSLRDDLQKNTAKLLPILNSQGSLEALKVIDAGDGYTFANIEVNYVIEEVIGVGQNIASTNPDDGNYIAHAKALVSTSFDVGDIESRQSNVELLAVDGAINAIKVKDGGNGYSSTDQVVISGDGTGLVANIVTTTGGIIDKINITNPGSGYTSASVSISSSGTGAEVYPILSPPGGHGSDAVSELFAKTIAFSTKLTNDLNQGILSSNDYRQFCIVKNPRKLSSEELFNGSYGYSCIVAEYEYTTAIPSNQAAYTNFVVGDILKVSVVENTITVKKKFRLIHKTKLNVNATTNKYSLLLQPIDSYVPPSSCVFNKENEAGNTVIASFSALNIVQPNVDKFSGEVLYIDNRSKIAPSADQSLTLLTLISF